MVAIGAARFDFVRKELDSALGFAWKDGADDIQSGQVGLSGWVAETFKSRWKWL